MDNTGIFVHAKNRRQSLTSTHAYLEKTVHLNLNFSAARRNSAQPSSINKRSSIFGRTSVDFSPSSSSNNKMWSNSAGKSVGLIPGRNLAGPLFLMLVCPTVALSLYHVMLERDGSLFAFRTEIEQKGICTIFVELWTNFQSIYVWKLILIYFAFQMAILKLVPGGRMAGPVTPSGDVPTYKTNGFQCFLLSIICYMLGVMTGFFKGSLIVDNMTVILASMNIFALALCLVLYLKGLTIPSSSDSGSTGNVVFDYYWGTELHPNFLGFNVKQLLICRISMTFWALCVLSCAFKQYEIYGYVSDPMSINVGLQLIYVAKFFVWESGYLCTVDICHDRAGFYLCWGVLVWLPSVHTSHSAFLIRQVQNFDHVYAAAIFLIGLTCIFLNYDCDQQRQQFRASKGHQKIWGKDPLFIEAKYKTENGETKTNLLLASGWWGVSRHFHYLPELLASFCWTCLPVGFSVLLPHFYVIYLTILMTDRACRDDARCRSKYGKFWDQYCYHVPYKMIPGLW